MYITDSNQYAIELVTYLLVLVVYFYKFIVYILLERNAFDSIAFFSQRMFAIYVSYIFIYLDCFHHFNSILFFLKKFSRVKSLQIYILYYHEIVLIVAIQLMEKFPFLTYQTYSFQFLKLKVRGARDR